MICGDNFINENPEAALAAIVAHLRETGARRGGGGAGLRLRALRPGLRHGLPRVAGSGVPAVTAMHPENPAASPTGGKSSSSPPAKAPRPCSRRWRGSARLALKLGRGEPLGPAEIEGYISQGARRVWDRGRPGYQRALDMLLAKLHGRPFVSEVPFRAPERVTPALPIADLARARIAMVTTGGLVRKGNPDKQVAANATRYHRHSVKDLEALTPEGWEAYHAGYFNHIVNRNPNYILPLSFLRDLEGKGQIGRVHESMYALPGVSTPVAMARQLGRAHRGGSQGGRGGGGAPRRHLRDLQSLRRNDSQGDRAGRDPGGHDLGHLHLRDDDGRQPGDSRRPHRARLRRSRAWGQRRTTPTACASSGRRSRRSPSRCRDPPSSTPRRGTSREPSHAS